MMPAESCRSRMIGILAAIWRFLPPYSGAVHLPRFNCFPILASFTLSSYNLTNISKFMRFLPNITCVRDFPPSRLAASPLWHTKLRFTRWHLATGFPSLYFLAPTLSLFRFPFWSLFILSPRPFQYFCVLTEGNSNFVSRAREEFSKRALDKSRSSQLAVDCSRKSGILSWRKGIYAVIKSLWSMLLNIPNAFPYFYFKATILARYQQRHKLIIGQDHYHFLERAFLRYRPPRIRILP